jgi:hypothetical protein
MRRFLLLAPALLAGCSLTVNQPSLTANTAVGDGSRVVGGGQAPGIAPASPAAPGAGGAAPGTATPAPPADGAPPDPAGAGVRDQQALETSLAVEASLESRAAQTFVAGRSGRLGAVGLRLALRGERAPEATLRLHAAPERGPTGPALAEAPVPAGDVTKDRDERWVLARFPAPVAIEQGTRYAWVLVVSGAFPLAVGAGDNRSYEAGEAWTSGRAAEVWSRQGLDLAFRTYLAE